MKVAKLLSLVIVAMFLTLTVWLPVSADLDYPPYQGTQDADGPRQDSKGAEVRVFFRGQGLTPTRPSGNQSEETANCPAKAFGGRFSGTIIGSWSMTIGGDTTMSGAVSIAIWARSQTGAKNAGFRVNLYRSGGNNQAYFTNRQGLSANPVKYTAEGTYNQQFSTGDTFDVQLVWLSDPKYGLGPTGGGEFLYGNGQFDSSVKVSFNSAPLVVTNISVPAVNKDTMDIRAEFHDILGCDPASMEFNLAVQGAATASPANLDEPKPSAGGGNSSSVSWTWHHKLDAAKTGDYTLTVTMSYDGNSSVMNTSIVRVVIPGKTGGGGDIKIPGLGGGGMNMLIYVLIIVIVVVVVVVAVLKRGKGSKKKPKVEKEVEEEDEAEDEDDED